nr:unnamed protein product [Digitaria exilis]
MDASSPPDAPAPRAPTRFRGRTQSRANLRWWLDSLSSHFPRAMPQLCIDDGVPRPRASTELVRRQAVQRSKASVRAAELRPQAGAVETVVRW